MTFCLDSTIIKPEQDKEIKNVIILLHGYGGDGKDISMLSLNWKRHLPNTIFICPNGHEQCAINPTGYQWFDLTKEDPDYILEQSIKAENYLVQFVDEVKNEYKLKNDKICLSGFSQGCMITLQAGLKRKDTVNSVIGYSGRIIDTEHLSKNINSRPKIILMHGDIDQVVSIDSLLEAKDFFNKNNYEIETKIFKNCEHRIPTEGSSLGLQFIKKQFNS